MSYGHGYGAPSGLHSQGSYPGLQMYPHLAERAQQTASTSAHSAEDGNQSSFDYLRTAIPGLGLGYAASGPVQAQHTENSWAATPSTSQRTAADAEPTGASAPAQLGGPADGGSEEGELSDGEVEDLYEPPEVGNDETLASWPYGGTNVGERLAAATDQPQAHIHAARERSGSYSPHLSPREIDHTSSSTSSALQGNSPARTFPSASSAPDALGPIKKQAQEAILRLWPLDVRYHNYLDAGIDSVVLQALFKDLGLELPATPAASSHSKTGGQILPVPASSEERKDRIARLLAAKGSKAKAPSTKSAAAPLADNQPATMKKLSEKSKLLQKKMEALKKQREALAQTRVHQAESAVSSAAHQGTEVTMDDGAAAAAISGGPSSFTSQAPESAEMSGQPSPSSIPGLFLSTPTPALLDQAGQSGSMTPGTARMAAKESHRPFGQNRESRPFLIHVSDDEDDENDDAEMEIDSPGIVASPVPRSGIPPHSAPTKPAGFPVPTRGAPSRRSASALTPARNSGTSSGGEDLDSMNKKIEAMKRKIAEAEARKAKRSRHTSPAASQHNGSSRGDSVESSSTPVEAVTGGELTNGSRTPLSDSAMHVSPASMPAGRTARFEGAGFALPASERRSRSRVASERLPLLEARRREQLLKLKTLQAQIAAIEQEIEESKAEEERLKEDLVMTESDQEPDQSASTFTPLADAQKRSVQSPQQAITNQTDVFGAMSEESAVSSSDVQALIDEQSAAISAPVDAPQPVAQSSGIDELSGDDTGATAQEAKEDVRMGEDEHDVDMADASESPDDVPDNESDDYEPPDAGAAKAQAAVSPSQSLSAAEQAIVSSAEEIQHATPASLAVEQAVPAQPGTANEAAREAKPDAVSSSPSAARSTFVPYETPLQYFHSYRFHPGFGQTVAGGLRSLTYSNKIDARREVCPDQLAGRPCPRGERCEFQHFETMRVADDQILLQLGGTGNFDDAQKQQYIAGLRELLTDFRNRKVKDFNTISQGIVEYRARFQGDKSKILPLGNVTI
ncbi:Zinc finger domain-containing protein, CCCH-type [Purpureocillium lilacinum]|uniref:Zinc finger domain-containing protein, CCCH-type n=1 Tax=Purpureocillium lilacinum TaxID=33203 RepID=A0A179H874_PURLI|nr:Zinc finger domain-containing protein, CCCH-type [Purpureocillium lilacinum]